ncbi:RagB/SusD family nutrient uptake outer membrane protein [Limibacter armeniacum]|uniref:RagB/SusD family nutrient uptake outer membrane protein n=1 Tax=Limibacter armeniacum TaxID=466084 RepID=UPI002FE5F5BE
MKRLIIHTIIGLTGAVVLGCNSFLEPERDNQLTEEQVLANPAFAEGLLLNAYQALPVDYNFEEVATDDAVTNNKGDNFLRMATGEWTSTFNPIGIWDKAYEQLHYINLFMERIDEVEWSWESEEQDRLHAQRLKGEAYGLRAWYTFELLKRHGGVVNGEVMGVPILTKSLTVADDWKLPRSSYQESVVQIMADCDSALALLTDKYENSGNSDYNATFGERFENRMNGWAVQALKARVALHAASPAFNEGEGDWEMAALAAGKLIEANGGVSALSATGDIFYKDQDDSDIIWRHKFVNNIGRESNNYPPSLFGKGRTNPTQNLVDAFPMQNGFPITDAASGYDPSDPYANRDPRLAEYIIYNGSKLKGNTILTGISSAKDGIDVTLESTRTGYYLKKFINEAVNLDPKNTSNGVHFYTLIRFTEVYLIYAEAANEAWGPDADPLGIGFTARDVVSAIRKRAGIDMTDAYLVAAVSKTQFRELVQNERRLELSFEGFRFWDLRRWDKPLNEEAKGIFIAEDGSAEVKVVEARNFNNYMQYGPVPYGETQKYNLPQNTGWQ